MDDEHWTPVTSPPPVGETVYARLDRSTFAGRYEGGGRFTCGGTVVEVGPDAVWQPRAVPVLETAAAMVTSRTVEPGGATTMPHLSGNAVRVPMVTPVE